MIIVFIALLECRLNPNVLAYFTRLNNGNTLLWQKSIQKIRSLLNNSTQDWTATKSVIFILMPSRPSSVIPMFGVEPTLFLIPTVWIKLSICKQSIIGDALALDGTNTDEESEMHHYRCHGWKVKGGGVLFELTRNTGLNHTHHHFEAIQNTDSELEEENWFFLFLWMN